MRKLHGVLDWTKLEWKIFFSMYENVRKKISVVTRQTDVTYKTVKRHFEVFVLPKCSIAHYFFPEGYDSYKYMYLRMKSDFEKSLIASFKYWPCTTYFYPLEDELDAVLFFESHEKILELLEKLKEIDVISDYLLYIPIVHGND